jgi:hypothetical protein
MKICLDIPEVLANAEECGECEFLYDDGTANCVHLVCLIHDNRRIVNMRRCHACHEAERAAEKAGGE